jgi:hypothetical protein
MTRLLRLGSNEFLQCVKWNNSSSTQPQTRELAVADVSADSVRRDGEKSRGFFDRN